MERAKLVQQIESLEIQMAAAPHYVKSSIANSISKLRAQLAALGVAAKAPVYNSFYDLRKQLVGVDEYAGGMALKTGSDAEFAALGSQITVHDYQRGLLNQANGLEIIAEQNALGAAAAWGILPPIIVGGAAAGGAALAGALTGGAAAGAAGAAGTAGGAAAGAGAAATGAAATAGISAAAISSGIIAGLKSLLSKAVMMAVAVFFVTELVKRFAPELASSIRGQMTQAAASIEEVEELAGAFEEGA